MTRHREELDDVLDRVAAAMTFVPADPTLASRIVEQIGGGTRGATLWPRLAGAVAAGAAIALIVVAVAVAMWRHEPVERVITSEARPVLPAAPVIDPTPAQATESHVASALPRRTIRRAAPPAVANSDGVPQIAALASPSPLDVAELPVESLTIAPVDLAPLDLASLAVAELDSRDENKE